MAIDYSQLLVDKNDQKDTVELTVTEETFFNKDVKELTLFYNIVGNARFKLFRNHRFELILAHVTDDWMRQAKLDISNYSAQLEIKITWDTDKDTLSVKGLDDTVFHTVQAVQIDN